MNFGANSDAPEQEVQVNSGRVYYSTNADGEPVNQRVEVTEAFEPEKKTETTSKRKIALNKVVVHRC